MFIFFIFCVLEEKKQKKKKRCGNFPRKDLDVSFLFSSA